MLKSSAGASSPRYISGESTVHRTGSRPRYVRPRICSSRAQVNEWMRGIIFVWSHNNMTSHHALTDQSQVSHGEFYCIQGLDTTARFVFQQNSSIPATWSNSLTGHVSTWNRSKSTYISHWLCPVTCVPDMRTWGQFGHPGVLCTVAHSVGCALTGQSTKVHMMQHIIDCT